MFIVISGARSDLNLSGIPTSSANSRDGIQESLLSKVFYTTELGRVYDLPQPVINVSIKFDT